MTPPRTNRAERRIAAPAARLFAGWTDPALLVRWLPPTGMSARIDLFDPQPGARFRLVLTHDDPACQGKSGDGTDIIAGRFVTLDPPRHLAFVSRFQSDDPDMQGAMRMDWHFDRQGDATRVTIVASNVPPGISPADHATGMAQSLAQLAAIME